MPYQFDLNKISPFAFFFVHNSTTGSYIDGYKWHSSHPMLGSRHTHSDQKSDSNTKPNINTSTFLKTQIQHIRLKFSKLHILNFKGSEELAIW